MSDSASLHRPAVIVNPTKLPEGEDTERQIRAAFSEAGWDEPIWLETTEDDPGTGQTKQALEQGADVVCVLGGDGTVRVVASGLVNTGVPLGILPGGTGNLVARQMEMPLDSLDTALHTVIHGKDQTIDVGKLTARRSNGDEEEHHYLVAAGVGFDAKMMADAPEELKKRVGWLAYAVSGIKHLPGKRVRAKITYDDKPAVTRRMRTVMVANCGRLTGGLDLVPSASVADGELDAVVLSPKGLIGWGALLAAIATRSHKGHRLMEHTPCKTIEVAMDNPISCELDGDPIGSVVSIRVEVLPGVLLMRVAE